MESVQSIEKEIELLLAKAEKLKTVNALAEMDRKLQVIDKQYHLEQHVKKSAAFIAFKKSEKYINGLQDDLKATGTIATDTLTGSQATIKQLEDGSFRTFDQMTVGRTIELSGRTFLVKSFNPSFAGSTAELLPLNATFNLAGKQVTPYSGTACNIEGMKMTVENRYRLSPDAVLTINGKNFVPASIYQNSKDFAEYELEPC